MQIKITCSSGTCQGINPATQDASNKIEISNCIITFVSSGTASTRGIGVDDIDSIVDVWNTVIYDLTGGSGQTRGLSIYGAIFNAFNCTIYNCGDYGIREVGTGTYTVKNSAVFGNTDDFSGTMTIDYCASDDGDGTNAVTPADWSTVFVDHTNGDFHLKSTDTDLIGAGVDDPGSGLYSDDIDGETRTSTWDIGADELTAVTHQGAAVLAGSGTLTAAGVRTLAGVAALSGSGTLAADAKMTRGGSATLAGVATLDYAATLRLAGAAVLNGVGGITPNGRIVPTVTPNLWTETQKARGGWTETQKSRGTWTETQKAKGEWTES